MSWVSLMSSHALARASLDWLESHPIPSGDIRKLTLALLRSVCHGDPADLKRVKRFAAAYAWPTANASSVVRTPDEPADVIVCGAAIAALNKERRALDFLAELGSHKSLKRPTLRAAGAVAAALTRGTWSGSKLWNDTPADDEAMFIQMIDSSLESSINVLNTPGAHWYTRGIYLLVAISMVGTIGSSWDECIDVMSSRLRPSASKRGTLLYKRMVKPPPADVIEENKDTLGIAAIDLGERLHIYHDGLTYSAGAWKLKANSPRAKTLIEVDKSDWDAVRANVDEKTWNAIEERRADALHLLAVDPSMVTATPTEVRATGKRFGIDLEVVSVLDT